MVPQTSLLGLNLERPLDALLQAAGMRTMTMNNAIMLNVLPALFTRAIHFVGSEAMTLWMIMIRIVKRNVWYAVGM